MSAPMQHLSYEQVQVLADRLFSRGISTLSTDGPKVRADLVAASRALRAMLRAYESATHRQLHTVVLVPEVV